jgi:cell fate regulator YaaT (PSP1 superfamily)
MNEDSQMKILNVYFTFDQRKIFVLYKSDQRVDFRELLKKLYEKYQLRTELKQLSIKESIQAQGEVGLCGLITCCSKFLVDIPNTTVKMLSNQKQPLGGSSNNGKCERLKCCLYYEDKYYTDVKAKLPSIGERIYVNKEPFYVIEIDALRAQVKLKKEDSNETVIKDYSDAI